MLYFFLLNSDTSNEELLKSHVGIIFYSCLTELFFNVNLNQQSGLLKIAGIQATATR